jgi:serine phosphatase RsbU (regulator of sigma subunit)
MTRIQLGTSRSEWGFRNDGANTTSMTDLVRSADRAPKTVMRRWGIPRSISLLPLLRKNVAADGRTWLPVVLVLGAIGLVGYADHAVTSISLIYLYILPLAVGAIFLRKEISYGLIVACILFHYFDSPRHINLAVQVFHELSALLCFSFVVYLIQRYVRQREVLAKTMQKQRDELLQDVELAAQVQRMFLPVSKPVIPGLEIAGMMQPARIVGGDYYDYIPIDAHTLQMVIADVAGKGVASALLMSATAAAMQLEANHERNMLEIVSRLNAGIHSVSDGERYVTLLLAEIDADERIVRYVNCGHNPALLFRAKTNTVTRLDSSCPPIGMFAAEICELTSASLMSGDVLIFYTDGVTEAMNSLGQEFGMDRLSAAVRRASSLPAEDLMASVFTSAANFCSEVGFNDDVTILVVKCDFADLPM